MAPFWRAGNAVFADDPSWVPPLELEFLGRLNPKRNPFFEYSQAAFWTAWQGDNPVGRCSAQVDGEHLRYHNDGAGFFGFLDTVNDTAVSRALLTHAEQWLRTQGVSKMRGPYSLSFKEEFGLLIDGFEYPPMVGMGHSRRYQGALAEEYGLSKIKDWIAWRYDVQTIPKRAQKAWEAAKAMPEVRFRRVRRRHLEKDLRILMDIFNDAWSDNWGFVPATESEVKHMVHELRMIIDTDMAIIVEVAGKPMGMCVAVPNLNEAIRDFDGKLGPLKLSKLLWRLKVKGTKTARLMLLGIRKELRNVKRYGGLSLAMYVEIANYGPAKGYEWGELSLTLEDNHPVNLGVRSMGGKPYKLYRTYEKTLD